MKMRPILKSRWTDIGMNNKINQAHIIHNKMKMWTKKLEKYQGCKINPRLKIYHKIKSFNIFDCQILHFKNLFYLLAFNLNIEIKYSIKIFT